MTLFQRGPVFNSGLTGCGIPLDGERTRDYCMGTMSIVRFAVLALNLFERFSFAVVRCDTRIDTLKRIVRQCYATRFSTEQTFFVKFQ